MDEMRHRGVIGTAFDIDFHFLLLADVIFFSMLDIKNLKYSIG